ncbi:MAG: nucleotidyltransferase domain-containing protein [Candidatus Altiarchaeota archaeon]|nr:nucleotidyltransferase domain-containing protein [Candidatus Altiarchaeota archaeon]
MVGSTKKKIKSKVGEEKVNKATFDKAKKRREVFLRAKVKVAERFSNTARQKLGNMVKGVAVIGSIARGDFRPGSDIDVLVVIDDTQRDVPDELKEKMLAMLNDIGKKIDKKMQVQIHTLTEMFQFLKEGDNIVYNFVRHMKVVYDGGMMKPLQKLLKAGEIKPTKESVMRSMEGADFYMKKVHQYVEFIVERYYRAVTWSSNAFIMGMKEQPASPPEIPIVLKKFADQGVLPSELPAIAAEVIKAHKGIEHGDFKPTVEDIYKLEPKVLKFLGILRKEVIGSVVEEGLKGAIKAKIKTMPKIIFEFDKNKCFAWLLDEGVYVAYYDGSKLSKVYTAKVVKGKVGTFKSTKNEKLFSAMEVSELKPLINQALIKMIYAALPESVRQPIKKVAIEYPGRAMIDLGQLK